MHGHIRHFLAAAILVAIVLLLVPHSAAAAEPGTAVVGIYRIAPGKHAEFLKWQAARDAIDKQVGVTQAQWYAHTNGDSWDYLSIGPVLSDAQQKKVDDATRAKGMTTGFKAALEFRQYVGSHTDTMVAGPVTVSEMSAMASGE
jgi:hypothetical protein